MPSVNLMRMLKRSAEPSNFANWRSPTNLGKLVLAFGVYDTLNKDMGGVRLVNSTIDDPSFENEPRKATRLLFPSSTRWASSMAVKTTLSRAKLFRKGCELLVYTYRPLQISVISLESARTPDVCTTRSVSSRAAGDALKVITISFIKPKRGEQTITTN